MFARQVPIQILAGLSLVAGAGAQQLSVTGTQPGLNALSVPADGAILVSFDKALDPLTLPPHLGTFRVYGKNTGPASGALSLENGDQTVRFVPDEDFWAGEEVIVGISHDLRATDGSPLRAAGFAFTFRIASAPAGLDFAEVQELTTDTPQDPFTRIYGAQTCDLDADGALDLAIVNENSSDVRVFLNRNDGSGTYEDFLNPPNPVGSTPSPNENADFDHDGLVDIVTCNTQGASVTVLLGLGDGTFQPGQDYPVGNDPRGLAVLDVDGDGDTDLAVAARSTGNVTIYRNDGTGAFGLPSTFDGGSSEYGLAAADFDNDGIMDLVVGASGNQQFRIYHGNGDGTFTLAGVQSSGGTGWMLACGDLNGDGNVDVSAAHGGFSSAAIALGDGTGHLAPPDVYPVAGFTTATDIGDLDGDGDLDWIVSSFGGGVWELRENDGSGSFTHVHDFPAESSPACAVILDSDGDRDLDIVLLDEIADLITMMENVAPAVPFCFGESGCPCGNDAPQGSGTGCVNSTGLGGLLSSVGSGSVSEDDLVLTASQLPANQFGLVFMGSAVAPPTTMGAGLRCARGGLFRYGVHNSGGAGSYSEGPGIVQLSQGFASAGRIDPGETWIFQAWYRNPTGPCATSNVTNALEVTFHP